MCINATLRYLQVGLALLACYSASLSADTLESLVMPGPVIEGHKKYEKTCKKCHSVFSKSKQDMLCRACHKEVSADIKNKRAYHGRLVKNSKCQNCHTEHKGRDADIVKLNTQLFNHNKTDFRLKGKHEGLACQDCHKKGKKYRAATTKCSVCHKKINPHNVKKLIQDNKLLSCKVCHAERDWSDIVFQHDKTGFKLNGKHEPVICVSCHPNDRYQKTPKDCHICHKFDDVHKRKKGKKCQKCHNSQGWKDLEFNHNKETKFPLKGKHKNLLCRDCHKQDPYRKKIKKTCYSCHKVDDKHNKRFAEKCETCHTTDTWEKVKFRHDVDTKFKLRGKHKEAACDDCHTRDAYKHETSQQCIACHKKDDAHREQLGEKCQSCHNALDWRAKVLFDHDITHFPLLGLHAALSCEECHLKSTYKDVEKKCHGCHKKDDEHKGRLGQQCQLCHNPNNWRVWDFDHNKRTNFKLDGKHKKLHCHVCHKHAVVSMKEQLETCNDCHAVDDVHNGQFGRDCARCHTTKSFKNARLTK